MAEHLSIAFDEENNIRVLEAEKYRESDQLKSLSMEFITKVLHPLHPGHLSRREHEFLDIVSRRVLNQHLKREIEGVGREKQMGKRIREQEEKNDGFKQHA